MIERVETLQRPHPDLLVPLTYQDAHFEHYEKQRENIPPPFVPPPDYDDGLN